MIKRLAIHRFRGIREGLLEDLGKINLLIGPNNSGKTAILELLYLGGTSNRPAHLILEDVPMEEGENVVFQATTSLRSDFLGLEPLPRLRQRHGHSDQLTGIPTEITEEGGLEINLAGYLPQSPIGRFSLGSPDKTRFYKEDMERIALFALDHPKGLPSVLIPEKFVRDYQFTQENARWHYLWDQAFVYKETNRHPQEDKTLEVLAVWAWEAAQPVFHTLLFDFHTANAHFNPKFSQWAKQQEWDWLEKIRVHFTKVFPEVPVDRIEVDDAPENQKGEAGYIRYKGRRLLIDQFGDGARHAFKVLATLTALAESVDKEHPGLFLWEDPELFMHPATLGRLLQEVLNLIQNKPVQVFITTQSLEVLAYIGELLSKEKVLDIKVVSLALKEGVLKTRGFTKEQMLDWLESGFDLRDVDSALLETLPFRWKLKSRKMEEPLW